MPEFKARINLALHRRRGRSLNAGSVCRSGTIRGESWRRGHSSKYEVQRSSHGCRVIVRKCYVSG